MQKYYWKIVDLIRELPTIYCGGKKIHEGTMFLSGQRCLRWNKRLYPHSQNEHTWKNKMEGVIKSRWYWRYNTYTLSEFPEKVRRGKNSYFQCHPLSGFIRLCDRKCAKGFPITIKNVNWTKIFHWHILHHRYFSGLFFHLENLFQKDWNNKNEKFNKLYLNKKKYIPREIFW